MSATPNICRAVINKAFLIAVLIFPSASGLAQSSASDAKTIPIFSGGEIKQSGTLTIGDPKKWGKAVTGMTGTSAGGRVTVEPQDFRGKGDALRAKWNGESGRGEIAIYGNTLDLRSLKDSHSLIFFVKVNSPPSQNVSIGVDCGYPCRAEYEVGGILRAIKEGAWTALPIPLSCFKSSEFDLAKINGPFLISTPGEMDLSIANIHIGKTPEGLTSCPEAPSQASEPAGLNPNFFYFVNGELIGSRGIVLGDPGKWGLNVNGLEGASATGKLKIEPEDFQFEDDALRLKWSKQDAKGELGIYGPAIDIAAFKDDAALTFDVKLRTLPRESVKVGMDCGYPCRAEFEVGMTLRKLKKDTWTSFPVPLNCLKSGNFDLSKVGGVFIISTSGKLDMSVANIRLEKLPEGTEGCKE